MIPAVRGDQPTKAALMCEWSPAAQESALRWLATCVAAGSAQREIELWKVVKTGRELRCLWLVTCRLASTFG